MRSGHYECRWQQVVAVSPTAGRIILGLSACGYPLTQLAVRRCGARGAAIVEAVCAALAIRDASMIAVGVPGRLRPVPAALLRLELAAGVVASVAGLGPLVGLLPAAAASSPRREAAEAVRRAAVAALFTLHTIRFGIYLRPDQGRRATMAIEGRVVPGRA